MGVKKPRRNQATDPVFPMCRFWNPIVTRYRAKIARLLRDTSDQYMDLAMDDNFFSHAPAVFNYTIILNTLDSIPYLFKQH